MKSRSLLFSGGYIIPPRKRARPHVELIPLLLDLLEIAVPPDKDAYC